jgi:CHAP domain.
MKTLEQFKNDTLGGTYGNPGTGTFKGECVSYVRLYMEEVLGINTAPWGNAVNYWTNPKVLEHFDRIAKTVKPLQGDVPVWGDDIGTWTGVAGHIGIIYDSRLLNQNYNGSKKVTINGMFAPGLLGYLRKKGGDMVQISREEYEDLKAWKVTGQTYVEAVNGSKAWKTDMKEDEALIQIVINDLYDFKSNSVPPTAQVPVLLEPGIYQVKK